MPTAVSLSGLVLLIAALWLFSRDRRNVPWITILSGLFLQFVLAAFLLHTEAGHSVFQSISHAITTLMRFSFAPAKLLFGVDLADHRAAVVAVSISAGLVFFSSLMAVLAHFGLLQLLVRGVAFLIWRVMRVSGAEALAASANIFLGQTESALVIRPFLETMTQSELLAVMTGGMANVSFGMFPAYMSSGIDPGHLLTASVISAPASLLVAKVLLPEQDGHGNGLDLRETGYKANNVFDAACHGASDGMKLALNVIAMLIAFMALAALLDYLLGALVSIDGQPLTFSKALGWLFTPVALLIGVSAADAQAIGALLGKKLFLNEILAYMDLGQIKASLSERSFVLATYALCGFANFSSVAIQIGGIGGLVPSRRNDLAKLSLRALAGGTVTTLMTAAVVGVLL